MHTVAKHTSSYSLGKYWVLKVTPCYEFFVRRLRVQSGL